MADLQLIDRAAVARMLGMTVEKFYRRYPELRANAINPFPGPVLGNQSGARWSPTAIAKWIEAGGEHATQPPGPTSPGTSDSADAQRQARKEDLRRRAKELASA